ncbi:hypothetical protein BJX63DRAFT_440764 [Aspergillus granulosus]|uniref:Uncharacterized protein n=1 Tax=Aspergillus granulosus TaxID=176169 RepID=A0ABR4HQ79_9EURO
MPLTWLITGCSTGLGYELAVYAARTGDTVIATSRNPSKLSSLVCRGVITKELDVSSQVKIQSLIDDILASHGQIDILVNNAAYLLEGAIEETSDEELLAQFDVNVFSQIRMLQAVLPSMRARRSGVIANIGSIGGWSGTPGAGFYCATKAAVGIYTEALKGELEPLGVKVTCIEPGYFRTNLLACGHKVSVANTIPELRETTKAVRDVLGKISQKQPGDPVKGARVIYEALTGTGSCLGRGLPARLPLGSDAIQIIGEDLERERGVLEEWKGVVTGTDCDDVGI